MLRGAIKDAIDEDTEEWQGFISKVKQNQKEETKKIKAFIESQIQKMMETQMKEIKEILLKKNEWK